MTFSPQQFSLSIDTRGLVHQGSLHRVTQIALPTHLSLLLTVSYIALFSLLIDGLQACPLQRHPPRPEEHYTRLRKEPSLRFHSELPKPLMLIAYLQIKRPEDLKSLCLTSKSLRAIATPPLYREVFLSIGGHKDIRVSGLLSRTNPGVEHIRKIYLHLEKVPYQISDFQTNSDDSSEDEVEVKLEDSASAARQAQFIVRLLLDFLPNDILEIFRWVPFQFVQCHRGNHCLTSLAWAQSISIHLD